MKRFSSHRSDVKEKKTGNKSLTWPNCSCPGIAPVIPWLAVRVCRVRSQLGVLVWQQSQTLQLRFVPPRSFRPANQGTSCKRLAGCQSAARAPPVGTRWTTSKRKTCFRRLKTVTHIFLRHTHTQKDTDCVLVCCVHLLFIWGFVSVCKSAGRFCSPEPSCLNMLS